MLRSDNNLGEGADIEESDTISVVIPVYKVEKYLDRCIRSVVSQTYSNLEIILVDDGSPDQSGKICDEWAKKDKRITVIHKENEGLSDARNAGLDIASGEYIAFVDSDDYINPEMYRRMYDKLKENNADLSICGYCRVDELNDSGLRIDNVCVGEIIDKKEALRNICKSSAYVAVWNKLYKRHLFQNIRFPKGKIEEDLFVMPRIFDNCSKIVSVSDNYYYYMQSPNSISRGNKAVRHLDGIEAYYRFLLYCEKKCYTDLLQEIACKMVDHYMWIMKQIPNVLPNEKKRLHEIKSMIRYGYLKHGSAIRPSQVLFVEFPIVYNMLRFIKLKLFNRP